MRPLSIAGLALVIVLAVSAAAASTASASRLILSADGTALPLGSEVELTGRENFAVNSSELSRECRSPEYEEMEVYATLGSTAHKPTLSFHEGLEYEGIVIKSSEMEIQCEAEGGYAFVYWNPGGETLTLKANGEARLRPMAVTVEYELFTNGYPEELLCHYSKGTLSGTNTATTMRQPLTAELSGTLGVHDSPRKCASTLQVSLSMPRIRTREAEPVEEEI